jgi:hypothetical protein
MKKSTVPHYQSIADHAEAKLREAEKLLVLRTALTASDKKRAGPLLRIAPDAMTLAIDLAERHPDRFADFDVALVRDAAAYEVAMRPLAQQLRSIADRIEEAIVASKAPAAEQTLALYGAAKSLARFKKGESMLPQLRALKALVRTRSKTRKSAAPNEPGTANANAHNAPAVAAPAANASTTTPSPTNGAHAPTSATPA